LVDFRDDPYLGPECEARAGRPAGFRSPHPSDCDLSPATTFQQKFKYFHETQLQFSNRVARAYYAREMTGEAIASLRGDLPALVFLQQLSLRCTEDPSVYSAPRGLVRLRKIMDDAEAMLPAQYRRGVGPVMRETMAAMVLEDAALPPGMFRQEEFDALSALRGHQPSEREGQETTDRSAERRELAGVIEERLVADAGARLRPTCGDPRMLDRLRWGLRADEVEEAIGGIAMAATAGRTLPRRARPAAQLR
jgi:hypothetical protein